MAASIVKPPDVCLVDAAAAGDREARRVLYERHREAAYRAALRITGRHEDALDVVQDAFIKAFDGLAGFQRDAEFRTWLVRIASNRALDALRARRVRRSVSLVPDADRENEVGVVSDVAARVDQDVGEGLERAELAEQLRSAVSGLPAEQRSVFLLYASGELTYGEIAQAAGIPIGTVMSRLFHARRRLREVLGDAASDAVRASGEERPR